MLRFARINPFRGGLDDLWLHSFGSENMNPQPLYKNSLCQWQKLNSLHHVYGIYNGMVKVHKWRHDCLTLYTVGVTQPLFFILARSSSYPSVHTFSCSLFDCLPSLTSFCEPLDQTCAFYDLRATSGGSEVPMQHSCFRVRLHWHQLVALNEPWSTSTDGTLRWGRWDSNSEGSGRLLAALMMMTGFGLILLLN